MHGHFVRIKLPEGVGIKARECMQSNRNTKLRRIPCSQVYPELIIMDRIEDSGNFRFFLVNTGFDHCNSM